MRHCSPFPEDGAGLIDNLLSSRAHAFDFLNQPSHSEAENFDVLTKMLLLHILVAPIFPKFIVVVYVRRAKNGYATETLDD